MIWLSWVFFGTVAAGFVEYTRHPTTYSPVGEEQMVRVRNPGPDTLAVLAMAPEVDEAIRGLGVVAPFDSSDFKLPYDGTTVYVLLLTRHAGRHVTLRVK